MTISTRITLIAAIAFHAAPSDLLAQASAVNASIEGVIKDATGGVLPGVTVTVTNHDTGASRSVVTNENGLYRAQLLPLGTYRVVAELSGFSRFTQEGVELSAGMTATVNVTLQVGEVTELLKPLHALCGRAVGESIGHHAAGLHTLEPVVANCGRGLQRFLDVTRLAHPTTA